MPCLLWWQRCMWNICKQFRNLVLPRNMCLRLVCFSESIAMVHGASRLPNLRWGTLNIFLMLYLTKTWAMSAVYLVLYFSFDGWESQNSKARSWGTNEGQRVQRSSRSPTQGPKIQPQILNSFMTISLHCHHYTPYLYTKLPLHLFPCHFS